MDALNNEFSNESSILILESTYQEANISDVKAVAKIINDGNNDGVSKQSIAAQICDYLKIERDENQHIIINILN